MIAVLAAIVHGATGADPALWAHLREYVLARVVANTAILVVGVVAIAVVLGTSLAWLTAACDFPGRGFFSWALLLPMAMPAYVLAFVAVATLDYAGAVPVALRGWFGADFAVPPIRSTGGVIAVLGARELSLRLPDGARRLPDAWRTRARGGPVARLRPLGGTLPRRDAARAALARRWRGARRDGDARGFRRRVGLQLRHVHDRDLQGLVRRSSRSRPRSRSHSSCSASSRSRLPPSSSRAGAAATRRPIPGTRAPARLALPGARGWLAFAFAAAVFALGFVLPGVALARWALEVAPLDLDARYVDYILRTLASPAWRQSPASRSPLVLGYATRLAVAPRRAWPRASRRSAMPFPGTVLAVGVVTRARRHRRSLPLVRGRRGTLAAGHGVRAAARLRRALPRGRPRPGAGRIRAHPARRSRKRRARSGSRRARSSRACTCRCSAPASARRSCSCSSTS